MEGNKSQENIIELKDAWETIKTYCKNTGCDDCNMKYICDDTFSECPERCNAEIGVD